MDQTYNHTFSSGLPAKLIEAGLLDAEAARQAVEKSMEEKKHFVSYLCQHNILSSSQILAFASHEFGMPCMNIHAFDYDQIPNFNIDMDILENLRALPLYRRGDRLFVAISDPTNVNALDHLKFKMGGSTDPILVDDFHLTEAIRNISSKFQMAFLDSLEEENLENLDIAGGEELNLETAASTSDDTPIVRFVNKMLLDAINSGASDIHFEPYEKIFRIRIRQDGILREHAVPPISLAPRISSRLKVISQLDISERRVPQDGRFKMKLTKQHSIDFRVSTCPTLFGEKVVMRILDPTNAQITIDALGYEPFQKEQFLGAIHKPQGMVLVTGPTGSGKTSSLYTALNILNTVERNISTAEDPVEINLPGINQVNVNTKAGLTFSVALRAFLRQDPDVVMVGEIRDLETAEIAIKAAQTGHMVLSTLHTNSAADTITRLINMGIPSYNLATSTTLIVAQRLARRLCEKCKRKVSLPEHALLEVGFSLEEVKKITVYEASGCSECVQGYRGRVGLYELMPISEKISYLILAGANPLEIRKESEQSGFWNLRKAGLEKVKAGITTIEEVIRVTEE